MQSVVFIEYVSLCIYNMIYFSQYYALCNHIPKKRGTVKCNWVK
jgi:hypothetical protein